MTEQFPHSTRSPHERQATNLEKPRRLSWTMVWLAVLDAVPDRLQREIPFFGRDNSVMITRVPRVQEFRVDRWENA